MFVLGGAQTDFARNFSAEGLSMVDMLRESTTAALADARIDAGDVDVVHVGNLAGELFTGQALLGGMAVSVHDGLTGLPSTRHEAACASGSVALLAALAELEAGRYDVALVAGIELMRNVPAETAAHYLGSACWVGREATDTKLPWPHLFARIADAYDQRYGLKRDHLARIAELNFANARRNPNAQARDWTFPDGAFGDDDELNPVIDGWLRKQDCGRITDGAVALVLASPAFAATHAARHGFPLHRLARVQGWGHRTGHLLLDRKLAGAETGAHLFPHVRQAAQDAYRRAGIPGPFALDAIELHDCFTISEYFALDHLGLTPPGQSWQAIEDGIIEPGGRLPVNPSGGLIGLGHPVGATGVRMVLDAARQVTGRAGESQVDGARRVGTLNIGGSATAVVSFVIGAG